MPQWLSVLLGIAIGLVVIGGGLFWAFKQPRRGRRSMLAPPSRLEDPMTAVDIVDSGTSHNSS